MPSCNATKISFYRNFPVMLISYYKVRAKEEALNLLKVLLKVVKVMQVQIPIISVQLNSKKRSLAKFACSTSMKLVKLKIKLCVSLQLSKKIV